MASLIKLPPALWRSDCVQTQKFAWNLKPLLLVLDCIDVLDKEPLHERYADRTTCRIYGKDKSHHNKLNSEKIDVQKGTLVTIQDAYLVMGKEASQYISDMWTTY
jgi:hypothetical protein